MNRGVLLFICCLLQSTIAFSVIEAESREQDYLSKFLENNPSNDRKALVYLIVAQEFLNASDELKAREYYDLVLNLETKEDKTPAYIQIIMLNFQSGSLEKVQHDINSLYAYWKSYSQFEIKVLRDVFDELKSIAQGDFDINRVDQTYFGHLRQEQYIKKMIAQKNYEKALLSFPRQNILKASIVEQTLFDLLNVLVKKQYVDELICSVKMNKYPKARSYNLEICRYLHRFLKSHSPQQEDLEHIESLIQKDYPDQLYLIEMLKDVSL